MAYIEVESRWPSPLAFGARRLSRSLAAHGLSPSAVYWLAGGAIHPAAYVPVGAPEALGWYLATSLVPSTAAAAILEVGLRVAQAVRRPGVAPLGRAYAAVAIAGGERRVPSLVAAASPVIGDKAVSTLSLVLTAGEAFNRVVMLPFTRGARQPVAVLKLGRVPNLNAHTEHEQRVLEQIGGTESDMRGRTPQPLGTYRWRSMTVAAETCAPGRPLSCWSDHWRASERARRESLRLVSEWLAGFQRATEINREPWAASLTHEWVDSSIAAFRQTFASSVKEERLFELARERSAELVGVPFPIVWNHWGFDDRNIFRRGNTLTVIDWESSSPGPPLWDLVYYLAHWIARAGRTDRRRPGRGLHQRLCLDRRPRSAHTAAVVQAQQRYAHVLDLDARFTPLLVAMFWAQRAVGRAEVRSADGTTTTSAAGNVYQAYVAALADGGERAFAMSNGGYERVG